MLEPDPLLDPLPITVLPLTPPPLWHLLIHSGPLRVASAQTSLQSAAVNRRRAKNDASWKPKPWKELLREDRNMGSDKGALLL